MLIHYMDAPSRRLAVPIHSAGWMKKWSKVTSCLRKWCDSKAWTKTYRSNPLNLQSTTRPNKNALIQKAKQHICNLYCCCLKWRCISVLFLSPPPILHFSYYCYLSIYIIFIILFFNHLCMLLLLVVFFRVIPLLMLWLGMVTMLLTSTT